MASKAIHILENRERHKVFKEQAFESSKKFEMEKVISNYESFTVRQNKIILDDICWRHFCISLPYQKSFFWF